jgi:hypothetical protein
MALVYSMATLVERVKRHMANGFPSASFFASDNEIQLYINDALAFGLVGGVYNMAKMEGNLSVPDGYLQTYSLPALTQDNITREWKTTLPQPPLSLPLGYSLSNAYFADSVNGKGEQVNLIKPNRASYRKNMPLQYGVNGRVEGLSFILEASDGSSLLDKTLYVTMASTRVTDVNAPLNVPDDVIANVFNLVTNKLIERLKNPKDIVKDDISAGNKAS